MLNNIVDLANVVGVSTLGNTQEHILALIAKAVYKSTVYGVNVYQYPADESDNLDREVIRALKIGGIVEGTDIEISSSMLAFPFSAGSFWDAVQAMEDLLADAEAQWHAQGEEAEEESD